MYRNINDALAAKHLRLGRERIGEDTYYEALSLPADESERALELLSVILEKDGMNFDARRERAWRYFELGLYESMVL